MHFGEAHFSYSRKILGYAVSMSFHLNYYLRFVRAEWVGPQEGKRLIQYEMDTEKRRIIIQSKNLCNELRIIDLSHVTNDGELQLDMYLSADSHTVLMLRPPHEYDLVSHWLLNTFKCYDW